MEALTALNFARRCTYENLLECTACAKCVGAVLSACAFYGMMESP